MPSSYRAFVDDGEHLEATRVLHRMATSASILRDEA